jgi:hypothetical protein
MRLLRPMMFEPQKGARGHKKNEVIGRRGEASTSFTATHKHLTPLVPFVPFCGHSLLEAPSWKN